MTRHLGEPHGGALVDLLAAHDRVAELKQDSRDWPSWTLTNRQLCDLELLLNGGFSPLTGFMSRADYEPVVTRMRLANRLLWPIPVTLDVDASVAESLTSGSRLALRDAEGVMLAALAVSDVWDPDREREAALVFGTADAEHPGVAALRATAGRRYVGGTVEGLQLPAYFDFRELRLSPRQLRDDFARRGWTTVVAFHTRAPMHRAEFELTKRAAEEAGANLLIHPAVEMTKPGDVHHYARVRCYRALLPYFPPGMAALALLPLSMRMAGPREAVWHAIIRSNYGCSHFIVGRDHGDPGQASTGQSFHAPTDAQELVRRFEAELGIQMIPIDDPPSQPMHSSRCFGEAGVANVTFPEVAQELRRIHPPRARQGCTIFFTGLSGSGKSTIANILLARLLERGGGGRNVTMLDGDLVRHFLSSELGFSREDRNLNVRRIGYVASEVAKHGGFAICAPIAPYDDVRKEARRMSEEYGGFVLIHVATPLEVCEARDRKGLYAKARAGIVKEFTGISDPYEAPDDAELTIDTTSTTPEDASRAVLRYLERAGYLG